MLIKSSTFKKSLKSIFFFNRFLTLIEIKYWLIELKIADIVWVLKKIKHLIELFSIIIVIYIDYKIAFEIVKQITLITFFTNKLNLCFIWVSNYIQRFNIELRYKLDIQHIIFDALFRFFNFNVDEKKRIDNENELNAFFIVTLIEIKKAFHNRLLKNYFKNFVWKQIFVLLNA